MRSNTQPKTGLMTTTLLLWSLSFGVSAATAGLTELTAQPLSSSSIRLTWTGETRVAIHRSAQTGPMKQIVPHIPVNGGNLLLDIFVDRSVIEIFVNSDVVLVQRVYPTRPDSRQFRLFAKDGSIAVKNIVKWEMDAANPW